jgi:peptide/nickel transport system substrate-binding protein
MVVFQSQNIPLPLRRLRVALLAMLFCVALLLTNCTANDPSRPPAPSEPAAPSNVLVFGSGGQPVNLEPGNIVDGHSIFVQQQIYNRLMEFKPGTTELEPALAMAWSVSADGKTWTFKLRTGVKFHDGTAFDAEAVKFNVDRWWDAANPNGYRSAGKTYEIWSQLFGGFKGSPDSLVQSVTVVDPSTIAFRLKQPFSAFPVAIASGYFGIASPAAIQKAGASYGTPNSLAVGTGAFKFKEWRTGDRINLEKNQNYWKAGLPKVEQLVIRFVTDPSARLAQLRAGQLDFTIDLAPDQKKEVDGDANLTAIPRPSLNVGYLALNPAYKPLSDVKVRQAIAYAINRPAIVQAFWGDLGKHTPHFLPEALAWGTDPTLQPYPFDPQKAKQLLTEAGYPNGFDLELWYMPVSRPYFPTPKPIAEAFAADLSAVGIRVSLKTKDWAAYLADRRKAPGYQAFMLGWAADYGDPDNFYYPHYSPAATSDIGNWKSDRVTQLLDQARTQPDQASRAKAYAEIDATLHKEVLRLPIVHGLPLLAQRKAIAGWVPSPLDSEPFEAISKK